MFLRSVKKIIVVFIAFVCAACSLPKKQTTAKLVVLISIDQMKSEYLRRFNPQLEAGFKYLLDSAMVYSNAHHNHATTTTAAGHAALATGFFPSSNGIIDNTVYNRALGYRHYSIEDTTVNFVGIENCELNKVSSELLLKNSLGDWVKKADQESKTYSVALKDRASILMGGKNTNRAFWFDAASTQMVSTDHYSEAFPAWAIDYRGNKIMQNDISQGWILDESFVKLPSISTDSFEQEKGSFLPWFPHTIASFDTLRVPDNKAGSFLWNSPYGDAFVLKFAHQLIVNEGLGQDDHTDVLTVGLSAADVIGHHFGPNSFEVLDYYNKIDFYIAEFIDQLNTTVGEDNYILVLTSDHGVAAMPEYLAEQGIDAQRIEGNRFDADLVNINKTLQAKYGIVEDIINTANYSGVEPNLKAIASANLNEEEVVKELSEELEKLDYIAGAYSFWDIRDSTCTKPFIDQMRNSHREEYGYFIKIVPKENYLIDMRSTGTTHGTPYAYDTHVPLIIKSPAKLSKTIEKKVYTVDIVPSILDMLGISATEEFDGESLVPTF